MAPTHDFLKASAEAAEHGLSVCGTFKEGRPLYFLVDAEATEGDVRDAAFEAVNGRPISDDERQMIAEAEKVRPGFLGASMEDLP